MAAEPSTLPEEEGESYLASLSDLMVGLLFIFIILLMTYALNYQVAEQSTAQVVEQLTNANVLRRAMLDELAQRLKAEGVQVQVDLENGVMRLPEKLLFDSASSDFRPGGIDALDTLSKALVIVLECPVDAPTPIRFCDAQGKSRLDAVFIEGHTDNQPISTRAFADNWVLSAARSRQTWQIIALRAPSLATLRNRREQPLFSISAYGETRPAADNDSEEGRAKNRRIDLRFIMDTPDLRLAKE